MNKEILEPDILSSFSELFSYIYKGDENSINFSLDLVRVSQIWDDLYDKDKDVSGDHVNYIFFKSIYELQKNVIWQHCAIGEHLLNVFLKWNDANVLEKEKKNDSDLNKAYMLRAGIYDIFPIIAYHLHGLKWALEVGPLIMRYYGEDLDTFKSEVLAHG